jgi:ferredoxin
MPDTLRVNPIACTGHGVCAELLPELISLDEWGYPIIDPTPVPLGLDLEARRAVAACPALALKLARTEKTTARSDSAGSGGTTPRAPR